MSPTFDRFYRGPTPWFTLPEIENPHFQDQPALREKMIRPDLHPELDRIASTLRARDHVWMVGPLNFPDPQTAPPIRRPKRAGEELARCLVGPGGRGDLRQGARSIRQVVPRRAGTVVNHFENTPLFVAEPRD